MTDEIGLIKKENSDLSNIKKSLTKLIYLKSAKMGGLIQTLDKVTRLCQTDDSKISTKK